MNIKELSDVLRQASTDMDVLIYSPDPDGAGELKISENAEEVFVVQSEVNTKYYRLASKDDTNAIKVLLVR